MKPSLPTPPRRSHPVIMNPTDSERHGLPPPADGAFISASGAPPSRPTPVPLHDGTTAVSLDFLMRSEPLRREDHTKVILDLLLDLQWAHHQSSDRVERRALGVVCPGNTLITTDGRVRLPHSHGEALSQPRQYAAPERSAQREPTLAEDIHAVGVMLLEMIAGRPLDVGEVRALTLQTLSLAPAWHRHAGDPLLTAALRATAPVPEHRWGTASEMALALGRKGAERISDRTALAALVAIELERDELLALHGVSAPVAPQELEQMEAVRVSGFHSKEDRASGEDWTYDGTPCASPWDDIENTG